MVQGALVGAAVGGAASAIMGGNIGQGVLYGAIGGAMGAGLANLGAQLGQAAAGLKYAAEGMKFSQLSTAGQIGTIAGAAGGGALSAAITGGDPGLSAITAGISVGVGGAIGLGGEGSTWFSNLAGSTCIGAGIGGVVAEIKGGNFWQGAAQGAASAAAGFVVSTIVLGVIDYTHDRLVRYFVESKRVNDSCPINPEHYRDEGYTDWGYDEECDCVNKVRVYGHGMKNKDGSVNQEVGPGSQDIFNPKRHIPVDKLCGKATIELCGCNLGQDIDSLRNIARRILSNPKYPHKVGEITVKGCDSTYKVRWWRHDRHGWCDGKWQSATETRKMKE